MEFAFLFCRLLLLVITGINTTRTCLANFEQKTCANFYSNISFHGSNITLEDYDEYNNLAEDGRIGGGWNYTRSMKITQNCTLKTCSKTYFQGACESISSGDYPSTTSFVNITSAKCACQKECKCEDIYMKRRSCARGYLKGGCNTCFATYIDLNGSNPDASRELGKVEAFRLRKGCTLVLNSEKNFHGEDHVIETEVFENYQGDFKSYECTCNDADFVERPRPPRPSHYPPLLNIPDTVEEILEMSGRNLNHPGLRSAIKSIESGRSGRNAYILVLGTTGSGKSSAINLLLDANVTEVGHSSSTTTDIEEYRIPVPIDEYGVANSELRVIDTPGILDTRKLKQDVMYLSTLDEYLANHADLKDRIPNIVLILHRFDDNRFRGEGANFVKMLRIFEVFRDRVTDRKYSNVVFVLTHFCGFKGDKKRKPESKIKDFKQVIKDYSLFPKPVTICVAENEGSDLPIVNGYYRLPNGDLYPRNIFTKMELITNITKDPIGQGVFRNAFRDSTYFNISKHVFPLNRNSPKYDHYFNILTKTVFSIEQTEITQILQAQWEQEPLTFRRTFSSSLPYLQRMLNKLNYHTLTDLPKTAKGILQLLKSITQDEATRMLLKKAFNITAPSFPHNVVAGYGYNVFEDKALPKTPFKMDAEGPSDIGYLFPTTLSLEINPVISQHCYLLSTKNEYIKRRLISLGIDGTIQSENFTGTLQPGYNTILDFSNTNGFSMNATKEYKLFELVLNDKVDFADEFMTFVKKLPPFNETDFDNVETWNRFFTEYGTHIVQKVSGGGQINIKVDSDQLFDIKLGEEIFRFLNLAEDVSAEHGDNKAAFDNTLNYTLLFVGGDKTHTFSDFTKLDIANASKLMKKWKESLDYNPTILTREMSLVPMSVIVRKIARNISQEVGKAVELLFKSELKYSPPKMYAIPALARENTELMARLQTQEELNRKQVQELQEAAASLARIRAQFDEDRKTWANEAAKQNELHTQTIQSHLAKLREKEAEYQAKREAEQEAIREDARREAEREAIREEARREAEREAIREEARREAEQEAIREEARREAELEAIREEARREAERAQRNMVATSEEYGNQKSAEHIADVQDSPKQTTRIIPATRYDWSHTNSQTNLQRTEIIQPRQPPRAVSRPSIYYDPNAPGYCRPGTAKNTCAGRRHPVDACRKVFRGVRICDGWWSYDCMKLGCCCRNNQGECSQDNCDGGFQSIEEEAYPSSIETCDITSTGSCPLLQNPYSKCRGYFPQKQICNAWYEVGCHEVRCCCRHYNGNYCSSAYCR